MLVGDITTEGPGVGKDGKGGMWKEGGDAGEGGCPKSQLLWLRKHVRLIAMLAAEYM